METLKTGEKIGRWTILEDFITTEKGEKKRLCRCDCGTERYVLERSLKYGGSLSCGCLTRENAVKANHYDIEGKKFGELTVLHKAKKQRKNGGVWWTCQCSCGNFVDYPATLLVKNRRVSCGGENHKKNTAFIDITNKRFNMLTALYPTEKRTKSGSVVWHCQCDCGNEVDVSYNELEYSSIKSCGCQKKEHDKILSSFLNNVDGTTIEKLKSKKLPVSNTTGHRGVYLIKGKYWAKINFQKKAYSLGYYNNIEAAIEARKEAELLLFNGTAAFYEKWKAKAEQAPEWAKNNPIRIIVKKNPTSGLSVEFLPVL